MIIHQENDHIRSTRALQRRQVMQRNNWTGKLKKLKGRDKQRRRIHARARKESGRQGGMAGEKQSRRGATPFRRMGMTGRFLVPAEDFFDSLFARRVSGTHERRPKKSPAERRPFTGDGRDKRSSRSRPLLGSLFFFYFSSKVGVWFSSYFVPDKLTCRIHWVYCTCMRVFIYLRKSEIEKKHW